MNLISVLLLMIMTTAPVASAERDFIDILTPQPQVSASADELHIVGRTSAASIRVILNERNQGVIVVKDSIFHYRLCYGYGLNEVTLVPLAADTLEVTGDTSFLEILYSPQISRRFLRIYPAFQFHGAVDLALCADCHKGVVDDPGTVSDEAVCLDCHHDLARKFSRHTEVDDKTCIGCHPPVENSGSKLVHATGENPCYKCHKDKIGEYAQEYIHGPVAGGGCVICHNPHGSQYEKHLQSPQEILCFSCHEDLESELEMDFVHKPFAEGMCTGCHDPHSTANKWVLVKSSEDVCISCHEELGTLDDHGHPFNVAPKNPLRVNLELTDRGVLECLSCHYAHSSQAPHLLRVPGNLGCVACHDDKQ